MRTLFCSLLLVASLLLAPATMAWDASGSKASLAAWQDLVTVVMGWFDGSGELGPMTDPDGVVAAADPGWGGSTYGQENDPDGDIGPAIDPEG